MPFWIIPSEITKEEFMGKYGLTGDLCGHTEAGLPIARLDMNLPDRIGIRIGNGETVKITLDEQVQTIFACTMDGSLSNEIRIRDMKGSHLIITAKGGFRTVSYPFLEEAVSDII